MQRGDFDAPDANMHHVTMTMGPLEIVYTKHLTVTAY